MSEHDQEQKTEEPSEQQIKRFRERGDVAKSRDLSSLVAIASGTLAMAAAWPMISRNITRSSAGILGKLEAHGNEFAFLAIGAKLLIVILAPLGLFTFFMIIAAQLAENGWNPTLKPLSPSFSKINPIPRFRQIFFSASTVIELTKALVKLLVIGLIAFQVVKNDLLTNGRMVGLAPIEILRRLGIGTLRIALFVGIAFALITIIDILIERYRHKRKMRMTKQEIKQENKDQEGDPIVKGRIRRKQREIATGRMMDAVKTADVVVVNPTHYSAALRYKMNVDAAPLIVALGTELIAAKIRKQARKHGVPVVSNPPLARALFAKGKVGNYIPKELYQAVAALLAWVYRATGRVA